MDPEFFELVSQLIDMPQPLGYSSLAIVTYEAVLFPFPIFSSF